MDFEHLCGIGIVPFQDGARVPLGPHEFTTTRVASAPAECGRAHPLWLCNEGERVFMEPYHITAFESPLRLDICTTLLHILGNGLTSQRSAPAGPTYLSTEELLQAHSPDVVSPILRLAAMKEDHSEPIAFTEAERHAIDTFLAYAPKEDTPQERNEYLRNISVATLVGAGIVAQLSDTVRESPPVEVSGITCAPMAFAAVRPAGHHSSHGKLGTICGLNSVMVGATRALASGSKAVGVYDIDVHFGGGTQDIAKKYTGKGKLLVADVYAAMYDKMVMDGCSQIEKHDRAKLLEDGSGGVNIDGNLFFVHDLGDASEDDILDDLAIQRNTKAVIQHFKENEVEIIFVALGLDAAKNDGAGAQITPQGYLETARLLRKSGIPCVFALEGGYKTDGEAHSVFGRSVAAILEGLTEPLPQTSEPIVTIDLV